MKTHEFLNLLEQHKNKTLLFEYAPNAFVGNHYHITEVKHIQVDSVDCGAQTDAWSETIVQLWESPKDLGKERAMSALKALGILKKVGRIKPYNLEAELKIEYSNDRFHTAQLFVNDYTLQNNNLILNLVVQKTDCKAKEACGIKEEAQPVGEVVEPCCEPGGNCC